MRKLIPSVSFTEQINVDIQLLKDAKKQNHTEKKQAKGLIKGNKASLTKDEYKALKIDFVRAKLRHKAAKAALKAAKKVLVPYLLKEIMVKTKTEDKEVKHKKDTDKITKAAKKEKVKKEKVKKEKVKKTIVITKAPREGEEVAVLASEVPQTAKITEKTPRTSVKKAKPSAVTADDLTLIEGIGAKIATVLNENGIQNFKQLAALSADAIKGILKNKRLGFADPSTWAEQAQLAVDGKLEELEALKKELKQGKRQ